LCGVNYFELIQRKERDMRQKSNTVKSVNKEVVSIEGCIKLIEAVCKQIDKDKCPCSKCKYWKQLQSDWCK
jgi:hypothetical protein